MATGLVAVAMALVGAGCGTDVHTLSLPEPSTTTAPSGPTTPTLPADLASAGESAVGGASTTISVAVGPGSASLGGTVLGPTGPVAGAQVEADRIVGDTGAVARATTAADGSWSLPHILGGRYRVRAWQSPGLGMDTPQVVYLTGSQSLSMTIQLTLYSGPAVTMAISPPMPVLDQPANLVVLVANPTVGIDGVVRDPPVVGAAVTLVDGPRWTVSSGNPLRTDANGEALFNVSCTAAGTDPLSAQVGTNPPASLSVPGCASPPPPTSTVPPYETSTTCVANFPTPTVFPGDTTTTSPASGGC